jgi:hypothetical protein
MNGPSVIQFEAAKVVDEWCFGYRSAGRAWPQEVKSEIVEGSVVSSSPTVWSWYLSPVFLTLWPIPAVTEMYLPPAFLIPMVIKTSFITSSAHCMPLERNIPSPLFLNRVLITSWTAADFLLCQ